MTIEKSEQNDRKENFHEEVKKSFSTKVVKLTPAELDTTFSSTKSSQILRTLTIFQSLEMINL